MTKILNGKTLALQHEVNLINELKGLPAKRKPGLVSFCNIDDPPSVNYTQMKARKAKEIGIKFLIANYSTYTKKQVLQRKISRYNKNSNIDGIMVQLPLPKTLRVFKDDLLELIDTKKDVDGLTVEGRDHYLPATVKGVLAILDEDIGDWEKKIVAVVGSKGEVGKPMVESLRKRGVKSLIEIDKDLGNITKDLLKADIVISSVGERDLIKVQFVKKGVIAIDVGLGDFDEGVYHKVSAYTPRIGGVGPMTVISLMENVVESYGRKVVE